MAGEKPIRKAVFASGYGDQVKIFAEGASPHRYVRKDGAWTKLD